jgi:hypothetical protein
LLAIAVVAWGLIDVRPRARVDPNNLWRHRTDVTVYTEAARALFDGRDPYAVTNPRGWRYLYPPLLALLMVPLALLGPQDQAFVWFLVTAALAWGGWHEGRRIVALLSGRVGGSLRGSYGRLGEAPPRDVTGPRVAAEERGRAMPRWVSRLALAAVAMPVLNCLQRGQVGVLLVYLLLLGFRLLLQSRTSLGATLAGAVLALPVVLKLTPALPVGMLVLMWLGMAAARRWPAEATRQAVGCSAGLAAGLVLYLVALPSVAIGAGANAHHLRTFATRMCTARVVSQGIDYSDFHTTRNQSLSNAVYRLGNFQAHLFAGAPDDRLVDFQPGLTMPMDGPFVERSLLGIRLSLLGVLVACGVLVAWRGDVLGVAAVFGIAAALTLAVSPLSRGHHYVMWLPGLLLVPLWLCNRRRTRWALCLSIAAVALVWAHYLALDWPNRIGLSDRTLDWVGRTGLLGLGTTLWCLAALAAAAATRSSATPGSQACRLMSLPRCTLRDGDV